MSRDEALRRVTDPDLLDERVGESVRTLVNLQSPRAPILVHPIGSTGKIVAFLGPGLYLVDLRIHDESLVGGAWYESFDMREFEFEIFDEADGAA